MFGSYEFFLCGCYCYDHFVSYSLCSAAFALTILNLMVNYLLQFHRCLWYWPCWYFWYWPCWFFGFVSFFIVLPSRSETALKLNISGKNRNFQCIIGAYSINDNLFHQFRSNCTESQFGCLHSVYERFNHSEISCFLSMDLFAASYWDRRIKWFWSSSLFRWSYILWELSYQCNSITLRATSLNEPASLHIDVRWSSLFCTPRVSAIIGFIVDRSLLIVVIVLRMKWLPASDDKYANKNSAFIW